MGVLVDGVWQSETLDTGNGDGRFVRPPSQFRNWVTTDGTPGPSGTGGFAAESGRYHLYVSYACPRSHLTLIYRKLKGLHPHVPISVVNWKMSAEGWTFEPGSGVIADPNQGAEYLHQLYTAASPTCSGPANVPLLWDREMATIVSNEPTEITSMFNSAFGQLPGVRDVDLNPANHAAEIGALNERIHETINEGVDRCGFATTQSAYEEALMPLFNSLDWLERFVRSQRYLVREIPLEPDWRVFTTLLRFDTVYVNAFKTNLRRIIDYADLWAYVRDLYQYPGIESTVRWDHIKGHYFESYPDINPSGIVPMGPDIDFTSAHHREHLTPTD